MQPTNNKLVNYHETVKSCARFLKLFDSLSLAYEFEDAVQSCEDQFLPACALVVKNGGASTAEYWDWMIGQARIVKNEI